MESGASAEDVSRKRMKFDEAWRKFVDTHESYLELLDSPTEAPVLEKAQAIYDEQLKRKLDLDSDVRLWHKDREPERGEYHSMFSGETRGSRRSGVSRSSLRFSTVSRKKEKLALPQLNLRQLKIRQQLGEQQHAIREKQEKESCWKLRWRPRGQWFHFRVMKKLMNYKKPVLGVLGACFMRE